MREWILGRHPVYEVLNAGRRHSFQALIAQGVQEKGRLTDIIHTCQRKKIPLEYVQRSRLDALGEGHQGVALQTSAYSYVHLKDILARFDELNEPPFLLILDALQDPQNLGTLLRTAEAVGVHGVILPLRRTATLTPAVVSASSGASEHLWIAQSNLAQAISELKDKDVWVIGLEGSPTAQTPDRLRLDGALALVVGNEGQGIRPLINRSCDALLRLPMRGKVESLNAAVAGSVALYLAWQARKFSG